MIRVLIKKRSVDMEKVREYAADVFGHYEYDKDHPQPETVQ